MERKAFTKDEKFIIALYRRAEKGDDFSASFSKYEIGSDAGIAAKGVDAICKLLLQANFIKKMDETNIYITAHGVRLASSLCEAP